MSSALAKDRVNKVIIDNLEEFPASTAFLSRLFHEKWDNATFEVAKRVESGAPGNARMDRDLELASRSLGHGTAIEEKLEISEMGIVTNKGIKRSELVNENVNLNTGITVFLGSLGSMKSFMAAHVDDISRPYNYYVDISFVEKTTTSWRDLELAIEYDGEVGHPSEITLKFIGYVSLLERAIDINDSTTNKIIPLMLWGSEAISYRQKLFHLSDLAQYEDIYEVIENRDSLEFSKLDSLVNSDGSITISNPTDMFYTEVKRSIEDRGEDGIVGRDDRKMSGLDVFLKINQIHNMDDFEDWRNNTQGYVDLSVFNLLGLCQLLSFNNLKIQFYTETPEYVPGINTLEVVVLINNGNVGSKLNTVNIRFRGLAKRMDVDLAAMIIASTYFGKVIVSSLNADVISDGSPSKLAGKGLDLTFIRNLIAWDSELSQDERRVIAEIRDDQAAEGDPTDAYLAACSTVITLRKRIGAQANNEFIEENDEGGVNVDLVEENIRFKYMKANDSKVSQVDNDNIDHLRKLVWGLSEYTNPKSKI